MRLAGGIALAIALAAGRAWAQTPTPPPVAAVVDGRLAVGDAQLAVFVSRDWSGPLPEIRRAMIVVHGYGRDAANIARDVTTPAPPPDALVIAPQFLAAEDVREHRLPDAILRWQRELWPGGYAADGPQPSSGFDALDAVLAKLGDRALFPNLSSVVLAGFSAGGQLVQRYAIVGRGGLAFDKARLGIRVRFVVGSPSSYAYFADERPVADGNFGPFAGAASCPDFNRWKYGFAGELPPYVAAVAALGIPGIERRYAERDIVYLVGANDNDPDHRMLDKSCAAEAQGPNRLARMQSYFAMLKFREGRALIHRMWVIDGAAHNAAKVLGAPCGRAVLFGDTDCPENSGGDPGEKERK